MKPFFMASEADATRLSGLNAFLNHNAAIVGQKKMAGARGTLTVKLCSIFGGSGLAIRRINSSFGDHGFATRRINSARVPRKPERNFIKEKASLWRS